MQRDSEEYDSCEFDWNCEKCYKPLCLRIVAIANFPSRYGSFKVIAFENNKDAKDHIMVVKGNVVGAENVLTRIHSSCVTGDVLGWLRCDCGDQLSKALQMIEKEGQGVLLYMQQEGRVKTVFFLRESSVIMVAFGAMICGSWLVCRYLFISSSFSKSKLESINRMNKNRRKPSFVDQSRGESITE
jgi:hypothetical protein